MGDIGEDYTPVNWGSGTDFGNRTKKHRDDMNDSHGEAVKQGITVDDRLPATIVVPDWVDILTVVLNDYTGSMGDRAQVLVGRLLYFELMRKHLLGQNAAVMFGSATDAHCRSAFPLQMRPPARDCEMEARMKELVWKKCEGGGSGQETYELGALYLARNVQADHVRQRIAIFFCDEMPYDSVEPSVARQYARVDIRRALTTKQVFDELRREWSVYALRVPYTDCASGLRDSDMERAWINLLGRDHVTAPVMAVERVVDVIYGIWARETGNVPKYLRELLLRQRDKQDRIEWHKIDPVIAALKPLDPEFGTIRDYVDDSGTSVTDDGACKGPKAKPIV
jgi:hypothetical protein